MNKLNNPPGTRQRKYPGERTRSSKGHNLRVDHAARRRNEAAQRQTATDQRRAQERAQRLPPGPLLAFVKDIAADGTASLELPGCDIPPKLRHLRGRVVP